jgi:hypothetical protein
MKKPLTAAIFLFAAGLAGASNSFITNFPQGYYINSTAGSTLTNNLGQFFKVEPLTNTNLLWVSTSSRYGGFLMELLPTNAPKTVANFLAYVRDGAYENTIIHRSTSLDNDGLAVLQAGGFTADGSLSYIPTFAPITNEYSLSNAPGTVAMAKMGGNPDSATSQWFINVSDNSTTLDSGNNGGFTVFAKVLGNAMSNVINPISALQTYNLVQYNPAFTETPLQGLTSDQQSLYLSNLVTVTRVATLPYFAFSSDSDACPADINSSTNLIVTFKHYPTNNPVNGIYITVAVTDTNGNSPRYTNYTTNIAINNGRITTNIFTNFYDGGNTGFYVVPSTLGSQTITFPQIPQQALSNNITNITTNYVANGSNIAISSITTNIYTSFTLSPFPTSSANVPVLIQILSGPIKVTGTNQTTGIVNGTQFTLTGTGTVTLKATTFGTGTDALVNYYYKPATPVTNSFVIKAYPQTISTFQTIIPARYGNTPFQIQIPTSSSGLPVSVKVLSGPATFSPASNTGTITITGAGLVTLAANQSGNALYAAAPQVTTSFTIAKAPQSITFPQSTTNLAVGQTVALSATSSVALPVSFSLVRGMATLTRNSLKITGPGTVSISASQSGNSNYLAATPVTNSYSTASNQTIAAFGTITNRPYSTNPQTIAVPAATSKLPVVLSVKSGPASLLTSNSISLTGTGTVTLVADQSGNSNNFAAPQVTTSFVVSKASQTISSFTGLPSKLTNGIAPFTVTIPKANSGLTNTTLLVKGAGKISSANTITLTNAGILSITATNSGNTNYFPAALTTNITVVAGSQSITFPSISSPLVVGTTNPLFATASSGLPVSYSLSPSNASVSLISNSIVIRSFATNTYKVIASQAGNTGWNRATSVTNPLSVVAAQPMLSQTLSITNGNTGNNLSVTSGSLTTNGPTGGPNRTSLLVLSNPSSGSSNNSYVFNGGSSSNSITNTLSLSNNIPPESLTNTGNVFNTPTIPSNTIIFGPTPTPTP